MLLRHPERADTDLVRLLENVHRQPLFRHHRPFELPIFLDERQHPRVDEFAAALAHHAQLFGQVPIVHWTVPLRAAPRPGAGAVPCLILANVAGSFKERFGGAVDSSIQPEFGAVKDTLKALASDLLSVWLAIQVAEIGIAAAIAAAATNIAQQRVDLTALTMGWPAPARQFCRLLLANIGTVGFVKVIAEMHGVLLLLFWLCW